METRKILPLAGMLLATALSCNTGPAGHSGTISMNINIDAASTYQLIDGFGVNINPAWWYNGEYHDAKIVRPAIDMLVDSLGATIYRAVIEEIDWEVVNDDKDPNHFNWAYYNTVFSNERFQGVWNTLRYLNQKGITNDLMISFMGSAPAAPPLEKPDQKRSWMGGTDYSIKPDMEDELAETIAAFLYYMRNTEKIQFSLVSPMNETDVTSLSKSPKHPEGTVEGPNIPDPVQYVRIVKKLAARLDAIGMSDIRFVAPDAASDKLFRGILEEMVKDTCLMGKMACWGVHQYGNDASNYWNIINQPSNINKSYWVTETAGIRNLLGQLDDDARAYIFWDGYDCVYQHGRRNGYGSVPPNDWVFWFGPGEGKPLIRYDSAAGDWKPRKQFYQFAQVMRFIRPGAIRIGVTGADSNLTAFAFRNPDGNAVIVGRNNSTAAISLSATMTGIPVPKNPVLIYTDSISDMSRRHDISVSDNGLEISVPALSVFTITGKDYLAGGNSKALVPEPAGWYSGDMHVHRNCGEGTTILPEAQFTTMMEPNNLAVISVLADMGDGEVRDSYADLPKVNGKDAPESQPGRIVHWDAEWHFDPFGTTFDHKALGGHLVLLGLREAHTIWDESPYRIIEWGKAQKGIVGFCHMEYLTDSIQKDLNCCIPIDYPVEAALGTIDFLAEDVWLNDAAVKSYYRLLNCGFRLGWAAGTDFPCNGSLPLGSLLTYVQVKDSPLTYQKWVEGIAKGRTVVTTNGHNEFIDLKVNGDASPGDEIKMSGEGSISAEVTWTSVAEATGRIELVCNGSVVAVQQGTAGPGKPVILEASIPVKESSWICARRMDEKGHRSHTAPVYINIGNKPVRASAADARFFVSWIDNILDRIKPSGPWNMYFTHDLDVVQDRYRKARDVYEKIASEAMHESEGKN